jgi:hypothetical protein
MNGYSMALTSTIPKSCGREIWESGKMRNFCDISVHEKSGFSSRTKGRCNYPRMTQCKPTRQTVVVQFKLHHYHFMKSFYPFQGDSGGTTGDNGADLAMSTSYQMVQGILETDPNMGSAWAVAAANAAEFGVKTTA